MRVSVRCACVRPRELELAAVVPQPSGIVGHRLDGVRLGLGRGMRRRGLLERLRDPRRATSDVISTVSSWERQGNVAFVVGLIPIVPLRFTRSSRSTV